MDGLFGTVSEKTNFITEPIESFSSVYSSYDTSTNLYNRTMIINDTELHVLPTSLEPAISSFRMVSTGVVVILTMISIYNRFRRVVKH